MNTAIFAAARQATALEYAVRQWKSPVCGEARHASEPFCRRVLASAEAESRPIARIAGGETVVTLGDRWGREGRNQEFALTAALTLAGRSGGGGGQRGDRRHGRTHGGVGEIVGGDSLERVQSAGVDAADALARHDAYSALSSGGDFMVTGTTGTNAMDLQIALIRPRGGEARNTCGKRRRWEGGGRYAAGDRVEVYG